MKAVPVQPSRHRWHFSLLRNRRCFFYIKSLHGKKMIEPLGLPSIYSKIGIATWKTHEKFTQNPIFQG